jgi:hypothetical protein
VDREYTYLNDALLKLFLSKTNLKNNCIYLSGDMALNFENTFRDADFLPTRDEMERYKTKLEMWEDENRSPKKRRAWYPDEYDSLGRNIAEQERRQNKIPWVKVKYISGRLYIDPEKKDILRFMKLI